MCIFYYATALTGFCFQTLICFDVKLSMQHLQQGSEEKCPLIYWLIIPLHQMITQVKWLRAFTSFTVFGHPSRKHFTNTQHDYDSPRPSNPNKQQQAMWCILVKKIRRLYLSVSFSLCYQSLFRNQACQLIKHFNWINNTWYAC